MLRTKTVQYFGLALIASTMLVGCEKGSNQQQQSQAECAQTADQAASGWRGCNINPMTTKQQLFNLASETLSPEVVASLSQALLEPADNPGIVPVHGG